MQSAEATDTGTAELPEDAGVAAAAAAGAVPEATATTAPAGTGAPDAAADTTAAAAEPATATAAPAAQASAAVDRVGAAEGSVPSVQCYELLQVPGFGSVRLLPAPDSTAAAAALKQSFVYALIMADSSYLLQLLQPQQAGKLALLARLQEAGRAALLQQQQQVAQLLDEVYACSQQQQQQGDSDGGDDVSVVYVPTDDGDDC